MITAKDWEYQITPTRSGQWLLEQRQTSDDEWLWVTTFQSQHKAEEGLAALVKQRKDEDTFQERVSRERKVYDGYGNEITDWSTGLA